MGITPIEHVPKFGKVFLNQMILEMNQEIGADYMFFGKLNSHSQIVETISFCHHQEIKENFGYHLKDTPCGEVVKMNVCNLPYSVQKEFPNDHLLVEMEISGYIGLPLTDRESKEVTGIIVCLFKDFKGDDKKIISYLRLLAPRIEMEINQGGNSVSRVRQSVIETIINQAKLKETEERYQLAIAATNLGIFDWMVKPNTIYYSPLWKAQIGYADEELENSFDTWIAHLHPDDKEEVIKVVEGYLAKPVGPYISEFRFRHKDGSYRWIHARGEVRCNEEGEVIRLFGAHRDITEKMEALEKLKENEARFKSITNQSSEGITVSDLEGNFQFVNPKFCEMMGYSEKELLTMNVFEMHEDGAEQAQFEKRKNKLAGVPTKDRLIKKNGSVFLAEITANLVLFDHTEMMLGTIRDITKQELAAKQIKDLNENLENLVKERTEELNKTVSELNQEIQHRIKAEKEVKEALGVKEMLLKEVTHRVKNNLQIISSLINLQKRTIKNEASRELLSETSNRIQSMALIHEVLYKAATFDEISFNDYVTSLVHYIEKTFDTTGISIKLDIEDLIISIDKATSCGMIIMELITNSIKYAFPEKENAEILISMKSVDSKNYQLLIQDNGVGFPKEIDFLEVETLGMQLVTSLTEQIDGEIKLLPEKGTAFQILFEK